MHPNVEELKSRIMWDKVDGLVPAIVQNAVTGQVLMLGYMNAEALTRTVESERVTFFSRSRNELWTKGETSGNFLDLVSLQLDCDGDTLLIMANPHGPTCHKGTRTCFQPDPTSTVQFITDLEGVIDDRRESGSESSYTAKLFRDGAARIAQKVGEEGVEVAIASMGDNKKEIIDESADLIFHLLVLLRSNDLSIENVLENLAERHRVRTEDRKSVV